MARTLQLPTVYSYARGLKVTIPGRVLGAQATAADLSRPRKAEPRERLSLLGTRRFECSLGVTTVLASAGACRVICRAPRCWSAGDPGDCDLASVRCLIGQQPTTPSRQSTPKLTVYLYKYYSRAV
ncbi:hypothetical protein MTO96_033486 [Rhipicephalus appendiculatus]